MVIPGVIDVHTLDLCNQYLELLLAAEGWNNEAYRYMQGPKGTRAMVTKGGWTKLYTSMLQCLLAVHPNLYALAAETLQCHQLSFNFYDLKLSFDRGAKAKMGKPEARAQGFEFTHTDVNYWCARLLLLLQHRFTSFYQFVVPIRQGKPGLAFAKARCHDVNSYYVCILIHFIPTLGMASATEMADCFRNGPYEWTLGTHPVENQ